MATPSNRRFCILRQLGFAAALAVCLALPGSVRGQTDEPAAPADPPAPADSEAQLIERRTERLRLMPVVAEPPATASAGDHPIDRFIAARWQTAGGAEAPALCDDATFLRRVYLDVIGVIPTTTEANRFLASSADKAKREKLIDQLLGRAADYAAHWTVFWEDALASQNVGTQGGILTRGNYRDWLLACFEQNRPFDVMVAELVDPTMPRRRAPDTKEVLGEKPKQADFAEKSDYKAAMNRWDADRRLNERLFNFEVSKGAVPKTTWRACALASGGATFRRTDTVAFKVSGRKASF